MLEKKLKWPRKNKTKILNNKPEVKYKTSEGENFLK